MVFFCYVKKLAIDISDEKNNGTKIEFVDENEQINLGNPLVNFQSIQEVQKLFENDSSHHKN